VRLFKRVGFRHYELQGTKQEAIQNAGTLDCFVVSLLAMTETDPAPTSNFQIFKFSNHQMSKTLIKNVLLDGELKDIYIGDGIIKSITVPGEACKLNEMDLHDAVVIDGTGKAVIPGLVNMHTHAAMTLFRGYADDMPLKPWLEQKIWPAEKKLTEESVYWGAKLACIEMIRSGTVTFFDMYHHFNATVKAVTDMGMRAFVSEVCFDFFRDDLTEKSKKRIRKSYGEFLSGKNDRTDGTVNYAIGPHAIYSVSGKLLQWVSDFAKDSNVPVQMHLAETEEEVSNSIRDFGATPVRYLHRLGILSPNLVLAHVIHIDDEEMEILADSGANVVHNPASNMKLASGYQFRFREMKKAGIKVALGTDGCASSNNLDMFEAMKLASLMGKVWRKDPEALTCDEMFEAATRTAADILNLRSGTVKEGFSADLCLIDLKTPALIPNHNFVSNLVYSANGSCVDTVICNGRILMQNRKIRDEQDTFDNVARIVYDLTGKQ
jgi:5-methylthioadenosine/S-adenosylhomocysteine deaminase